MNATHYLNLARAPSVDTRIYRYLYGYEVDETVHPHCVKQVHPAQEEMVTD